MVVKGSSQDPSILLITEADGGVEPLHTVLNTQGLTITKLWFRYRVKDISG